MSDDESENSMLKTMGFSSFGTSQRSGKEPKEKASGEFSASGANSAPLAKRAKTNTTNKLPPLSSSPPTFTPTSFASQPRPDITATAPMFTPSSILLPPAGVALPPRPSSHSTQYGSPPGVVHQLSPNSFAQPPGPPAYTNPTTGISFTNQELNELKRGKRNEKGGLVFFQPSFVDEDPWKVLKKKFGV